MARICRIRHAVAMSLPAHLDQLSADELRQLAQQLAAQVASQTRLLTEQDARFDKDKELHWAPDQDRSTDPRTGAAQALALRRQDRTLAAGTAPAVRGNVDRSGGDGNRAGAVVHAIRQTGARL